ncbi:hypothetical protein SAMN06265365_13617 [Tistlia consotensis]|uniref:Ammonia monooxygenase n=1 Tax=Tistlia consotensis USBA 355 TaxID=560819 RepID=A0A1Y6CTH3_9PROT|nr:AbrB family transcriptional regulator [Tistlia consotensis]SMF78184.1 hypothetical protein SAMN05428998_13818 [Tistlia consotensis USBA 355]SNS18013.1 hypothetical protein SAMN06265365_13617 [Tistlia consotensis]
MPKEEQVPAGPLARWPAGLRWALLLALSLLFAGLLELPGIPAALLLGPMIAGIVVGTNSGRLKVPAPLFWFAQAVIGLLVAGSVDAGILATFAESWPLFVAVILAVISASSLLGWLMARWQVLPGTTAVWGFSPGAASAMMLMADAFGADARLVAFMQYLRVLFVAVTASLVAQVFLAGPMAAGAAVDWFPALDWPSFGPTLALVVGGALVGRFLPIPAGSLLVPMILGGALSISGVLRIALPEWLLAISYALIGWNIGLAFTRRILLHATRALPKIALSIAALIAFGACLGFAVNRLLGVDPLTAYLATSPGGLDTIAIIAASAKVDVSFVLGLQTARFLMVLLLGPFLARMIARRVGGDEPAE